MQPVIQFLNAHSPKLFLAACIISLALHLHVFNRDLVGYHVWRQTQTQTVINNFAREDMNILNSRINDGADGSRILRMEFPIMQWIFALFYKAVGNHIIISRLLTFIIGLCTVWGFYRLALRLFQNSAFAGIGSWAFTFSPVFYYYTINPLPDNFALCCAVWSLAFFYKKMHEPADRWALWFSAGFLSLATLAKLPFILYGAAPMALLYLVLRKRHAGITPTQIIVPYALKMIPAIAWYAWVVPQWDNHGIKAGILDANTSALGLLDILHHNLISTLPELIVNYGSMLAFLGGGYFIFKQKAWRNQYFLPAAAIGIAAILYFLFEMNMIEKVHDYYLFPFLPPVMLIVAYGAWHLLLNGAKAFRWLALIGLIILPLTAFLRADTRWDTTHPEFNPALYRNKEKIRSMIPPDARVIVGNDDSHFIMLYYVDRKGWTFTHDNLDAPFVEHCMQYGARYLFSDSKATEDPAVQKHLKQIIFEDGTLKVYELQ